MKLAKYMLVLFIFCNLLTSCSTLDSDEDEALFNISATGDDGTPPDNDKTGG